MTPPGEFPAQATIDEWIRWLEDRRRQNPTVPLATLLPIEQIASSLVIELVCVDLILCHRAGNLVTAEDYLDQLPGQFSDGELLDLIDAELCMSRELQRPCDPGRWIQRFPHLEKSIRELAQLDSQLAVPCLDLPSDAQPNSASASASFELSLQRDLTLVGGKRADSRLSDGDRNHGRDDSIDVPVPIAPPEWMSSAKCIASTMTPLGRCWVIKGRDAQRGETVLMKVMPLPPTIGASQRTRILDLCETTSSVTHPHWIAPRIAAIRQGHLAVVRPWIFGTSLAQHQSASETNFNCLAPLVQLGITLSAAHRGGATHGLISANNVIVNHQANIQLVDAASSAGGWATCLMHWSDDLQQHLPWRIENDVRGYQQLVVETCLRFMPPNLRAARSKLIQRVVDVLDATDPDTCITIAEDLQRTIDQPTTAQPWWRR